MVGGEPAVKSAQTQEHSKIHFYFTIHTLIVKTVNTSAYLKKTKEDFSLETRLWSIGLKSLVKDKASYRIY